MGKRFGEFLVESAKQAKLSKLAIHILVAANYPEFRNYLNCYHSVKYIS